MTVAAVARPPVRRLTLSGGAVFMISAAVVHAGNYAFNVILGRQLGPALFSELSLIVTFLLVLTFVASTLQTTATRFVATGAGRPAAHQLHGWLVRSLRPASLSLAILLTVAAPWLAGAFRLTSPLPLLLLAVGIPTYLAQAVHRGVVQGSERFGLLAGSYQAEVWVRLVAGAGMVAAGFSVGGATAALLLSFGASWLVLVRPLPTAGRPDIGLRREVRTFARSAALLLAGETLISHGDLIIAKLSFDPATAGAYAAVSLIGRLTLVGSWPVVALIFPIAARRHASGIPSGRLLAAAIAIVGGGSLLLTVATVVAPGPLLELALGSEYTAAAPWLGPYVAATGCFAVARTLFAYHLARGIRTGAHLALAGGVLEVAALSLLHGSPMALVWVQLTVGAGLLAAAVGWHLSHPGSPSIDTKGD